MLLKGGGGVYTVEVYTFKGKIYPSTDGTGKLMMASDKCEFKKLHLRKLKYLKKNYTWKLSPEKITLEN